MNTKQLLVPTDLSENKSFYSYVFNCAAVIDAGITFFHSFHPQPVSLDGMMLACDDVQNLQREAFERYVGELNESFKEHEVEVECEFKIGFAADTILEYADESQAYMILMANAGSNTIKKLFGSVSTEVMKRSDVPVLFIPVDYEFQIIKQVVYADDFTDNHDKGMIYLDRVIGDFLADLICAHVEKDTVPPASTDWIDLSKLNKKFSGVQISQITINHPSVMKGIIQIADESAADLIIIPSNKKGFVYNLFHNSVTRQIVLESPKPILVIH